MQDDNYSFILFCITFFLLTSIVGLFYLVLNALSNNKVLNAFITISLVILDSFTSELIPAYFKYGYKFGLLNTLTTLTSIIILLIILLLALSKRKDFIARDDE